MKHEKKANKYANFPAYPPSVSLAGMQQSTRGYWVIINDIQPCPKGYLPTDEASSCSSEN